MSETTATTATPATTTGSVTHEYDPATGLNWVTIEGPVTTCLVCHRLLAGDVPVVCDTCATADDAEVLGAYGG